jgi:hypothetical protein
MVRGRRGGRRRGARGGGATPPAASMPEGSNPQGGQQVLGQEKIAVSDVVGMMRSFQRMSEVLISRMDREEAGSIPEVCLFLTFMEEYAQGVQTLCDPCAK